SDLARWGVGHIMPVDNHLPAKRSPQPGDRFDQFSLSVALYPRDADDLARAHFQRDTLDRFQVAVVVDDQIADHQYRISGLGFVFFDFEQPFTTDHHFRQRFLGGATGVGVTHHFAHAQHGDLDADFQHLFQLVADEDDAHAPIQQRVHD